MSNGWGCPHSGSVLVPTGNPDSPHYEVRHCGQAGYVCPACREDRADRRNRELVEGLALAGLLANPGYGEQASKAAKDMNTNSLSFTVKAAKGFAGRLRSERGGGGE